MAIDRRLNGIWLKGSPDRIARMKAMIAMIDIPPDSVILETQFVELTKSGSKAIGIDFANANGQIGVVTDQTGQFIPPGVPSGPRLVSANFQAAIYAQLARGNGRIVSKPRISAQSGSTAKVITGDAIPILTNFTLSGGQLGLATGPVHQRRGDPPDGSTSQRRWLGIEPCVRGRVERD